jgi:RNA polymerase sigma-70 factor (ECF subfamily)
MQNDPQRAFVARFLREQHRLYGYIVTLVPQRSDAEEIFQETSLRLWEKWEEFDESRDLFPWACGIAHNVLRNYLRKKKPLAVAFDDHFLERIGSARLAREDDLAVQRTALEECLQRLPLKQRKLVEQCYSTPRPLQELAATLGLSANALYLKLRRLRETLLECITRRTAQEGRS